MNQVSDLTVDAWKSVFKSNSLLRGFTLQATGPETAPGRALDWKPEMVNYAVRDGGIVKASVESNQAHPTPTLYP